MPSAGSTQPASPRPSCCLLQLPRLPATCHMPQLCAAVVCVPGRSRSACFSEWQVQLNQRRRLCRLDAPSCGVSPGKNQQAAPSFLLLHSTPLPALPIPPPNASCQKSAASSLTLTPNCNSRLQLWSRLIWSKGEAARVPQTEEAAWQPAATAAQVGIKDQRS